MSLFQWLERYSGASRRPELRQPQDPDSPVARRRFRFSGNVQGVGFRYEASMIAGELGLTGWARNESDGTVTVETQGAEACIAEFLRVIQSVPRFRISEVQTEALPVSGTETAFRIRY